MQCFQFRPLLNIIAIKKCYFFSVAEFKNNFVGRGKFRVLCNVSTSQFSSCTQQHSSALVKTHDWNRAISDAERIVGYPTSFFSLRCLLSDEFSNFILHLRKLAGTNHPILKTAKRLVYHGKTNLQTRGLIVLLLSKAAGHTSICSDGETARVTGITPRQQTLAEITEMIYSAHLIHKGILNISSSTLPDKDIFQDLQFGNKVSVLSGDFLLANACKGLANLRNCKVVDLIGKSIGDFMQAEFIGERDKQGNSLPEKGLALKNWEEKNFLSTGSLLANSCKAALELAGQDEAIQTKGFEFGKNIGFAWQAYSDLQPFVDHLSHPPSARLDFTSLPVIFHFEHQQDVIEKLKNEIGDDVHNCNFKLLHEAIMDGSGIEKTKERLYQYSEAAESILFEFGSSPASKALSNIINSLKDPYPSSALKHLQETSY